MSTDGQLLINSLSAKISQCGKCDCCQDLQNQINQLKAQINNNKGLDAKELFEKIKPYLLPAIAPIAIAALTPQFNFFKNQQAALNTDLLKTQNTARKAFDAVRDTNGKFAYLDEVAKQAKNTANSASQQAARASKAVDLSNIRFQNAIKGASSAGERAREALNLAKASSYQSSNISSQLANVKRTADGAWTASSQALANAGNAALEAKSATTAAKATSSKLGSVLAALAGIAASVGVLKFTEGRFNAVERTTDRLGGDIDRVLQTLGIVNSRAQTAQRTAEQADKKAEKADDRAFDAQNKAGIANNTANDAKVRANTATQTANQSINKADAAANKANSATKTASEASNKAEQANGKANEALRRVAILAGLFGGVNGKFFELAINLRNELESRLRNMPTTDLSTLQNRLNGIDGRLAALAGLAVPIGQIQNKVSQLPDAKQVQSAAQKGSCDTMNSPQCTANFESRINKNTDAVGRALNNGLGNLFNGLNLGANSAQLAMLQGIDRKLGAQVPGGLGGAFTRLFTFLKVDRILNLLTAATTIHNAAMLSNNIGVTLGQAIGNIFALIGIKDESGNPFDVGQIINGTVENLMKAVIGEANYTAFSITWAKANRIYQASINALNSLQNLTNSVLNGLEVTAGRVGKIGNALIKSREVLENSYPVMNENPKFNGLLGVLERYDNAANTIVQVTQAPLEIIQATTDLQQANTELVKALKEDDNPANKGIVEQAPQQLSNEQQISKEISQGIVTSVSDWFGAND